jgi:hypothetical protein
MDAWVKLGHDDQRTVIAGLDPAIQASPAHSSATAQ